MIKHAQAKKTHAPPGQDAISICAAPFAEVRADCAAFPAVSRVREYPFPRRQVIGEHHFDLLILFIARIIYELRQAILRWGKE